MQVPIAAGQVSADFIGQPGQPFENPPEIDVTISATLRGDTSVATLKVITGTQK
jgi:hypothetical protein